MKNLNKTILTLSLATLFTAASAQAATSSGSANLEIKGKILKENSCSINLTDGGLLDVGEVNILDLPEDKSEVLKNVRFTTNIDCLFDTAVAVKFGSSIGQSKYKHMYSDVKTPKGTVAVHTRLQLKESKVNVDGKQYNIAFVGNQSFDSINVAAATIHSGDSGSANDILANPASARSAVTFVDKAKKEMVQGKSFSFPFEASVISRPTKEWLNDVDEELVLNHTATLETFIL